MAKASSAPVAPVRELKDLTRLVQRADGFPELLAALKNGRSGTLDGAWGSAGPLAAAALGLHAPQTFVIVLAHVGDVDDFRDDVATFAGVTPEVFPAWERLPREANVGDEVFGRRLQVIKRLSGASPPRFIVAPFQAFLQPVPTPALLARSSRTIRVGDTIAIEELTAWLAARSLTRAEVVEVAGEYSLRGGILDIFSPDSTEPVRIEFFGDDVESIRPFDPETQRSLDRWNSVTLTVSPSFDGDDPTGFGHIAEYLPKDAWVALVEPNDLKEEGRHYLGRTDDPRGLYTVDSTLSRLFQRPSITLSTLAADSLETTCHLRIESVERFSGELAKVKVELDSASGGDRVLIACHNEAEIERLSEVFADTAIAQTGRLQLTVGRVRSGFHLTDAKTLVIGDHELFARTDVRRPTTKRRYESRAIDSFLDLNEGDLVVHVNHGIARYRGLQMVDRTAEHTEETLLLEFAEGTKMFVPIAKIDLVQKYVGGGKGTPPLSKIGSSAWEKRKKRVADAVVDLAAELIDIQAARASQPGIAYPAEDSHWMAEFEAAFPYQETPDQLSAIDAVKEDMAKNRPMDRLICGDVGYGKTEVAIRAAFKAVDGGKQVAVLVPTTILAEQHHRSFSARMAEFPFAIEVVNRFRPKSEIRNVLKRTTDGSVDILIGTHRIVQKDVAFKDLGLVVIDEEQRFGVEDKEWLKSLRSTVDVLTLSATPIPRTLHMSLLGIRDISNLETPPPDRKAIETRILRFDAETVKRAIHRELNRDGQVYFVHNRVHDIQNVADRIQAIVPEARITIAHGQMGGEALERTMLAFIRRDFDILVATTIIESGLDIPNVNTIFINEADKYGLADLHQLRGRVGRYKHRAYAYLLLESEKPVTPNAVKRLKAIEEFTELGAGFKIALRDLEIRGAGNILGAEQSGHIESVGYELYCSLLEAAVRGLTNQPARAAYDCSIELSWRAYLPKDYVPGPRMKVELYRRLGRLRSFERLADFRQELIDRFGPLSNPAENLIAEAELRILAERWQLERIHVEDEYVVLTYRNPKRIATLAKLHPGRVRVVDEKTAYVPIEEKRPHGSVVVGIVKPLLQVP
ncbi:transcription-repair coupling factor [Singulisphaera acidiphila]|uniref:Transcription-repair-coupling factor n=1 Tax=Singulisphaera acidiphila (strain ATCC BAA-1392 / DSM 18658 / VKM B-2454 / MOB10) TaxID=886293 RepID=L0DMA1_SINAD|nr:transcription-repair coupling factor [Singulisphaera acidiphila]AGA30514.1 transcription-repair coupling factor Mfd [Singulisphaera acidiphila DSM 18658]